MGSDNLVITAQINNMGLVGYFTIVFFPPIMLIPFFSASSCRPERDRLFEAGGPGEEGFHALMAELFEALRCLGDGEDAVGT